MGITTSVVNDGKTLRIQLPANFDIGMNKEFRNINKQTSGITGYEIDFSRTAHIDSSALGMLLLLREELGGDAAKIEFTHCTSSIKELLRLARFDELFTIV